MTNALPEQDCELGYTSLQVEQIMGDHIDEFWTWMSGQTMAICEGTRYDYDKRESVPTGCGPHGAAVYRHDITRFLDGLPIID